MRVTSRDRVLAYIAIFTFTAIAVSVTAFAIFTRPFSALVAVIPTLVATYALFAIKLLIDKKIEVSALTPSKFNYFGFGYVFFLLGAAFVTYGLYVSAYDGIHYLTKLDSIYHVAMSALIVGIALFFFRLHVRFWYGAVEVAVGVIVAMSVYQTNTGKDTSSLFLTVLTAGVYLIVRGLDNVHQGWATDKLNKFIGDRFTSQAKKQKELAEQLVAEQMRRAEEESKQREEAIANSASGIARQTAFELNKLAQLHTNKNTETPGYVDKYLYTDAGRGLRRSSSISSARAALEESSIDQGFAKIAQELSAANSARAVYETLQENNSVKGRYGLAINEWKDRQDSDK